MRIHKSKAVFWGLFLINLIISVLAFSVLPEKYFYDAKYIIDPNLHGNEQIGSYGFTIAFYKKTMLSQLHFALIALIQFPILLLTLYKLGVPPIFHKVTIKNLLIYMGILMLALFVSMPSKEFITFMYLSLLPFVFMSPKIPNRYKIALVMLLLVFFGLFFRIYFILIPIIAIGMYLITLIDIKNRTLNSIFYGILIAFLLSLTHGVLKGEYLSETSREFVNDYRKNRGVNSMVISPVKPDVWYGEAVSITYGFVAVNLPFSEGIKHFKSPQIVVSILWQLILFFILVIRLRDCLNDRENRKFELWTILIIFAYFIVQGVFEPDLGTATRHKVGFLPLIYYVFYHEYFRKKS